MFLCAQTGYVNQQHSYLIQTIYRFEKLSRMRSFLSCLVLCKTFLLYHKSTQLLIQMHTVLFLLNSVFCIPPISHIFSICFETAVSEGMVNEAGGGVGGWKWSEGGAEHVGNLEGAF